jgi:hypothetical protein
LSRGGRGESAETVGDGAHLELGRVARVLERTREQRRLLLTQTVTQENDDGRLRV